MYFLLFFIEGDGGGGLGGLWHNSITGSTQKQLIMLLDVANWCYL